MQDKTFCFLKAQSLPGSKARIEIVQELPVIHLYGTAEEMGRQYGTLLKGPINEISNLIRMVLPKKSIDGYVAAAKSVEKNLPDDLKLQLKAVSEASGAPYDIILAINMTAKYNCSGLTVMGDKTRDGKMIFGRNLDYFAYGLAHCGNVMIVFHPKEGKKLLSLSFIGFIGAYTGINEDGVAFGNMLVFNSVPPQFNRDGMTIQLLFREAAFKVSSADAFCDLLLKEKHIIPMNVMVADGKKAYVLEIGAEKFSKRFPENNHIAATNYFLNPEMSSQGVKCDRFEFLSCFAAKSRSDFTVESMEKALLGSAMGDLNLQSVVFVPVDMRMYLSMNRIPPAAKGPFKEFNLKELFKD